MFSINQGFVEIVWWLQSELCSGAGYLGEHLLPLQVKKDEM